METDAKGQLGGLDASRQARERIAGESIKWVCGTCGRSNKEILREVEDAVREKEKEEGGESSRKEEEVPKELRIGWKEDMERERAAAGAEQKRKGNTEAELAEGFVSTTGGDGAVDVQAATASPSTYPPARPAQSVPLPTASIATNTTTQPQVQANGNTYMARQLQAQRRSNDGVPMWIDRAIAGIVICLVAVVLKMLLGL
jgi:ubiquitin-conjugating enzyme E2 J1